MKNVILINAKLENPIDDNHLYYCIGQNCWGTGKTHQEAFKQAAMNASRQWRRFAVFRTFVVPKAGLTVSTFDGSLSWDAKHNAAQCPFCTVGKGMQILVDDFSKGTGKMPSKPLSR